MSTDIGIYWIAFCALSNVTYFDCWKSWKRNSKFQAYDSVVCGYFCIGFIDFMLKGKSLTGFNLFSPSNFKMMI